MTADELAKLSTLAVLQRLAETATRIGEIRADIDREERAIFDMRHGLKTDEAVYAQLAAEFQRRQ